MIEMITTESKDLELTEEQRLIVEEEGDLLVLAGPGCGKTSTMILKIKNILTKGISPQKLLVLTFSLRNSQELREKLNREGLTEVKVDTFHGLAYDLWRDTYGKQPKLITEEEKHQILRKLFPKDREPLRNPLARETYFNYLKSNNLCDFDLLFLLEKDYRSLFEGYHVFVDEFQDMTPEIIHFLANFEKARLYLFGDPNQSIYGFKGVDLTLIKSFLDRKRAGLRLYSLTKSFRCPREILDFARTLQCSPWQPQPFNSSKGGGIIQGFLFPDSQEEKDFLVNLCYSCIGGLGLEQANLKGVSPSEIFVLARVKKILESLMENFLKRGLPISYPEARGEELLKRLISIADRLQSGFPSFEDHLGDLDPLLRNFVLNLYELFGGDREKLGALLLGIKPEDLIFPSLEGINFLTIHSAKGLEAEVVILVGAEDGLIPLTLFKNYDLDEEKRVLYVALTRAKSCFYFSAVRERRIFGFLLNRGLSRWLREIPFKEFKKRPPTPKQGGLF